MGNEKCKLKSGDLLMVARAGLCDRRQLELAIANQLSSAQSEDLSRHLQGCSRCQETLEMLAGERGWWNDARAYLSSSDDLLANESDEEAEAPGLDFLEPADRPGLLGKLGDYEIEEVIGRGGMGIVLKAHDPALGRRVAVKVLAGHLASSAAARKRFAREAKAAAAVVHDHVIPIHQVATSGQTPYLVMPLIAGRSLQERLDECGILEIKEALRIAMQTAQGLAAAHAQGLVHRDIKPANILLENGVERVRITDFGLARASDDASQTQSGFIAGTPQYMAPEQARGELADARADLFSLGSVLYAMCAGHPPFRAETTLAVLRRICDDQPRDIREVNPDVPPWLANIIHKLLAKSPADRFSSAEEVASLLERWLAHVQQPTVVAKPEGWESEVRSQRSEFGKRMALGIAAVAVLCVTLYLVPKLRVGTPTADAPRPSTTQSAEGMGSDGGPWEPGEVTDPAVSPQLPAAIAQVALEPPGMPPDAMQIELNELRQQAVEMEARLPGGDFGPPANLALELGQIGGDLERLERKIAQ
jgi:eukaryotic-like serine/threonine-protein kinase